MVPGCQIPRAIFQQMCEVEAHRSPRRRAEPTTRSENADDSHSNDEISSIAILMITKFLNVLAFSPIYPVYQMCTLYIHLYNPINPSIFAGSYCRAYHFDMVFHSTEYTQMHWLELTSAFKLWFDILTCLTKYFYSSAHICGIIYMSPHTMITQLKTFHSKCS